MVQLAGFKIDFVFSHLQKVVHAHYETEIEINPKSALYRTLEQMDKVEQKINQLSEEIDKQKGKMEKLRNKKERIISSHASETSRLEAARYSEALKFKMKNVGTGLL